MIFSTLPYTPPISPTQTLPKITKSLDTIFDPMQIIFFRKHRYKVRRSPSHIKHLLPPVMPLREFHQLQVYPSGTGPRYGRHPDGVMESKTQTTLLQHNLGPPDLPPLYQPQHRASV